MTFAASKPCKNGHLSERNARGKCLQCARDRNSAYRARYPERMMARDAARPSAVKHARRSERRLHAMRARAACKAVIKAHRALLDDLVTEVAARNRLSPADKYRARYREDPEFALKERMRRQVRKAAARDGISTLIRGAVTRGGRSRKVESLLGYTIRELVIHLEKQFTGAMTMADLVHGRIHIDHVIPKAAFDLSDPQQWRACWSLSNLQPLWAADNLAKRDRLPDGRLASTIRKGRKNLGSSPAGVGAVRETPRIFRCE